MTPQRGAVLCFPQANSACLVHEGSPVHARSKSPKYAVRTEVLYTFPDQGEPPA